jgi:hypothetical protein
MKTAVEWLMEIDKSRAISIEEWQQAREMEKEQIVEAYGNGYEAGFTSEYCVPEQYYNETFNTNEK